MSVESVPGLGIGTLVLYIMQTNIYGLIGYVCEMLNIFSSVVIKMITFFDELIRNVCDSRTFRFCSLPNILLMFGTVCMLTLHFRHSVFCSTLIVRTFGCLIVPIKFSLCLGFRGRYQSNFCDLTLTPC